ncbi:thioredoxin family protein [uncultured Erythrobacter sp.]|uniref:thioredoxin family protein n=1 Tax=uncultured Erythrobacter sp. TaxID=263913 RepID=UPI002622ADC7|nr:thioredoxin family protein [uncultured Erythrobacter sp.]
MIKAILSGLFAAILVIGGAVVAGAEGDHDYPEARLYDASIDAGAAVDAALKRAQERQVHVLIAFGANWCHDSRAFAGWTQSERIGGMIEQRYELVFINVGYPQAGDGHNQHLLNRFGIGEQEGTPLVLVVSHEGEALNAETAQSWRNTASRSEDEIYGELVTMADKGA